MTATLTAPAAANPTSNVDERTKNALRMILCKLGGEEFAGKYLGDFLHYVRTGELTDDMQKLRDEENPAFLAAFDRVCRAQARALAEVVAGAQDERPSRSGLLRSVFTRSLRRIQPASWVR